MNTFVKEELNFYLEVDPKFKWNGNDTFKFANANQEQDSYVVELLQKFGWVKKGLVYVKKRWES